MDFSWATISLIDIGLFSFGVVAVATGWMVKKREDQRYNTLQAQYETLQHEHETLRGQYGTLPSAIRDAPARTRDAPARTRDTSGTIQRASTRI